MCAGQAAVGLCLARVPLSRCTLFSAARSASRQRGWGQIIALTQTTFDPPELLNSEFVMGEVGGAPSQEYDEPREGMANRNNVLICPDV